MSITSNIRVIIKSRYKEILKKCSRGLKDVFGCHPPSGRKWATSYTANVGRNKMNSRIRVLPNTNGLLGWLMSGYRSVYLLVIRIADKPQVGR